MATKISQRILYLMATKAVDFANDSFIIILMQSGFVFNITTHKTYANVSASELGTAYGYTVKTKALTGVTVTQDDTLWQLRVTWANPQWTASGGAIGPVSGAIIIDDTVANDPIVEYIDFGGDNTEPDGGVFTIANIKFQIETDAPG